MIERIIDVIIITYKSGPILVLPKDKALETIIKDFKVIQSIKVATYQP
jgi:hypothetical protein